MESLDRYLSTLKLPGMLSSYKAEAEECLKSGVSYEVFLNRLAEQEVLGRMSRQVQVRIKKAQFPSLKTIDSFNFDIVKSLNKTKAMSLIAGNFAEKKENVLALGNSGTGKTHLAISIGMAACRGEKRGVCVISNGTP